MHAVQVRLNGTELESLEEWRRKQDKIPPRSEAIREAIRQLVRRADALPLLPAPMTASPTPLASQLNGPRGAATAKPGRAGQP
jgi:hypothetical protein